MTDDVSYKIRREVKRKRKNTEIDVNSCLQLLMDVTTDMLDPKVNKNDTIKIEDLINL